MMEDYIHGEEIYTKNKNQRNLIELDFKTESSADKNDGEKLYINKKQVKLDNFKDTNYEHKNSQINDDDSNNEHDEKENGSLKEESNKYVVDTDTTIHDTNENNNEDSNENSNENENETDNRYAPQEESYLPSWVLKMRSKIKESRIAHEKAESRIGSLQILISKLDKSLENFGETSNIKDKNKNKYLCNFTSSIHTQSNYENYGLYSFSFHIIPNDILCEIYSYLIIKDILKLECTSKIIRNNSYDCPYWKKHFVLHCPDKSNSLLNNLGKTGNNLGIIKDIRREMISHIDRSNQCINFIVTMKNQRCIKRHNSIEPHRYSKSERTVTHPLPVFKTVNKNSNKNNNNNNNFNDTNNTSNNSSSNNTNRYKSQSLNFNLNDEIIMSRTETLNSDFRHTAHKILEIMFSITKCSIDLLHERLVSEGAFTVFISLLSNEAGVLQHYSCGIIANMLCWESRKNYRLEIEVQRINEQMKINKTNGTSNYHKNNNEKKENNENKLSTNVPLSYQIRACGGQSLLLNLLTSPSSCVNLAGTVGRVSGGYKEVRMNASVQGISSKQASRALITLFCPSQPIPATTILFTTTTTTTTSSRTSSRTSSSSATTIITPNSNTAMFTTVVDNKIADDKSATNTIPMDSHFKTTIVLTNKPLADHKAIKEISEMKESNDANILYQKLLPSTLQPTIQSLLVLPPHIHTPIPISIPILLSGPSLSEIPLNINPITTNAIDMFPIILAPIPVSLSIITPSNSSNSTKTTTTPTKIPVETAKKPRITTSLSTPTLPTSLPLPISPIILQHKYAIPWMFNYYHKSGALKDSFSAFLYFSAEGNVRWIWYFHKTYVSEDVAFKGEKQSVIFVSATSISNSISNSSSINSSNSGSNAISSTFSSSNGGRNSDSRSDRDRNMILDKDNHCRDSHGERVGEGMGKNIRIKLDDNNDNDDANNSNRDNTDGDKIDNDVTNDRSNNNDDRTSNKSSNINNIKTNNSDNNNNNSNNVNISINDSVDDRIDWGLGIEGWIRNAHIEYIQEGTGKSCVHVAHVGYWSEGVNYDGNKYTNNFNNTDIYNNYNKHDNYDNKCYGNNSKNDHINDSDKNDNRNNTNNYNYSNYSAIDNYSNNNNKHENNHNSINNNNHNDNNNSNNNSMKNNTNNATNNNPHNLSIWGMALYGVWETGSIGSHFDLQKGGVFSATPITY